MDELKISDILKQLTTQKYRSMMEGTFQPPQYYLIFGRRYQHAEQYAKENNLVSTKAEFKMYCKYIERPSDVRAYPNHKIIWLDRFWFDEAEHKFTLSGLDDLRTYLTSQGNIWNDPKIFSDLNKYIDVRIEEERKKQGDIDIKPSRYD